MMPPVSGWFTVRVLQALCAALALLVSPGLQLAHAHTVSEQRAPSGRASAGGGRVVDEGSRPTPPARTARPLAALAGQGGGRRRAAARQRGEQRPGEASKHPLWLYHCEHEALVWFELDTIGNVRRLRGAQRFFGGAISSPPPDSLPEPPAPLPTDLGGYKYTAFGRLLPPDAGTPAPTALGQALSQPIRWQGRWFEEETGLYDFRNRVWSPELGAFLSPDEFGYLTGTGSLWSWPGQNPIRWRDPSGRDPYGEGLADALYFGNMEDPGYAYSVSEQGHGAGAFAGFLAVLGFAATPALETGVAMGLQRGLMSSQGSVRVLARVAATAIGGARACGDPGYSGGGGAAPSIGSKVARQMAPRGWTPEAIARAIGAGQRIPAVNKATGNAAMRFVHPETGRSVVVDLATNEVIHVGGPGFKYGSGSGDLP